MSAKLMGTVGRLEVTQWNNLCRKGEDKKRNPPKPCAFPPPALSRLAPASQAECKDDLSKNYACFSIFNSKLKRDRILL